MTPLALLCIAAAAADPGDPPAVGDGVAVSLYPPDARQPDAWRVGEALFAIADGVLVRAEPDESAPAVRSLAAGAPLTLRAPPTPHEVAEGARPDRWLAVRVGEVDGWARFAALTAAGWALDLDGDGAEETLTAGFNGGGELVLRVRTGDRTHALNLGTRQDIEGVQGEATVGIMPAEEAGIVLVHANWSAREQCGSGDSSAYASFVPAEPGAAPQLREALHHNGSGGDAPIWWETTAAFDPVAGTATITSRAGEDGDESVHNHTVERYTLAGGVYTLQDTRVLVSE
jgi:hypothetical protein